jgi:hypothetical protein
MESKGGRAIRFEHNGLMVIKWGLFCYHESEYGLIIAVLLV